MHDAASIAAIAAGVIAPFAGSRRGLLDMAFLADGVGIRFNDVPKGALSHTCKSVQFEPLTLLSALAMVTQRVGLVATASTTCNEPYHVARKFASLDHISGGRAGWNVVTSATDMEARNFGLIGAPPKTGRYARATPATTPRPRRLSGRLRRPGEGRAAGARPTPAASRWNSGGRTRPGSASRAPRRGSGPDGARGPSRRRTAATPGPTCSARSAAPRGVGAGLVLPLANTDAMNLHLAEIS